MFVPILAAQVVVLLAAPIYYPYYGDYLGVALAMVAAAAARPAGSRSPRSSSASWPALWPALWPAGAALTLFLLLTGPPTSGVLHAPDSGMLAGPTSRIPCIVADTPWVLIDLNALDRSFEGGCRNWVDFQGVGHGGVDPAAYVAGDRATPAWRRLVSGYLASGNAVVLSDPTTAHLLTRHRSRVLMRSPLLADSNGVLVLRTPNDQGRAGPPTRSRSANPPIAQPVRAPATAQPDRASTNIEARSSRP